MTPPGRVFYRRVKANPPTLTDFQSHQELGTTFRRPLDPEAFRLSFGLSVSDDAARLRSKAAVFPELGDFIAILRVDDGGPVRWEKTTKRPDHYTLWGTSADIRACVIDVEPL